MKKNLISILILSLLVVNVVLTAIMMFSVTSTNKKTAEIVTDIAGVLNLELNVDANGSSSAVSMEDTEVYSIPDSMTITVKRAEGETKDTYCIVNISLSLNKTHDDYAKYQPTLETNEGLIKSEIIAVIQQYTADEIKLSQDQICDEILKRVQALYGSDFIYKVSISNIMFG